VLADLSANYVEKQALLCGYTAERVRLDYGIDLVVQTFNRRGEVESSRVLFQLKATDRRVLLARANAVPCRVDRADLRHWLEEPFPVVLVLYAARTDTGYWLYVRHHFANPHGLPPGKPGGQVTVLIPSSNVLDRDVQSENRIVGSRVHYGTGELPRETGWSKYFHGNEGTPADG
jgi:hypothetical protein